MAMGQFIENLQYKLKTSSSSLFLTVTKIFVGLLIGLTFALIGQTILDYGQFSFFLVIISLASAFYRVARGWKWSYLLSFSLICVLLGLLLKMYIQIAPGA
jgi:hypothetical protein